MTCINTTVQKNFLLQNNKDYEVPVVYSLYKYIQNLTLIACVKEHESEINTPN